MLAAAALAVLLWSCRHAPLGVPVADDYDFLYTLRFTRPLDWLGAMGATVYWRPLGRQLYFSLLGPWLPGAPWLAALVHVLLLVATAIVLFAAFRRRSNPAIATGVALYVLLGEPARVLLGWPSGAQYLLAGLFASLAALFASHHRWWPAAGAALAAALCHELGTLAIAALPVAAWLDRPSDAAAHATNARGRAVFAAGTVAVLFALGYALALRHGVLLSGEAGGALHWEQVPGALGKSLVAQLNLEGQGGGLATALGVAYGVTFVVAIVMSLRRGVRARLASAAPLIAGGLLVFVLASAAIALAPAWNAWRTYLPGLALGAALVTWLGTLRREMVAVFLGLRLVALAVAPAAPAVVDDQSPVNASDFSFQKLARVQRTVESTRRVLAEHDPYFPRGSEVRFTGLPRLTYFGFKGSQALRVWYADSTLAWRGFGGTAGFASSAAFVAFDVPSPWPARAISLAALGDLDLARLEMRPGGYPVADSLLAAALAAGDSSTAFRAVVYRARAAVALGQASVPGVDAHALLARADSLVRMSIGLDARDADTFALAAMVAATRGDRSRAADALRRCLARNSNHQECLALAKQLGLLDTSSSGTFGR